MDTIQHLYLLDYLKEVVHLHINFLYFYFSCLLVNQNLDQSIFSLLQPQPQGVAVSPEAPFEIMPADLPAAVGSLMIQAQQLCVFLRHPFLKCFRIPGAEAVQLDPIQIQEVGYLAIAVISGIFGEPVFQGPGGSLLIDLFQQEWRQSASLPVKGQRLTRFMTCTDQQCAHLRKRIIHQIFNGIQSGGAERRDDLQHRCLQRGDGNFFNIIHFSIVHLFLSARYSIIRIIKIEKLFVPKNV